MSTSSFNDEVKPEPMGEHALAYARAGLPVLPLHARAKTPATRHGKDDATTNVDCIVAWWSRHPDHNIGVRPPQGMVVLNVDPRHDGDQAIAELIDTHGPLPDTWTCRTGSGGRHIWLRARGPFRGQLCPGVDLKAHTGYLVVPPSVHPSGGTYEWMNSHPIAHAPGWLLPLLKPPAPLGRAVTASTDGVGTTGLVSVVADAQPGNRNSALFWAASRAAAEGTLPDLTAQLVAAAIGTGMPEREALSTIRSAERTPRA